MGSTIPGFIEQATSARPIEEGFFRCLRIHVSDGGEADRGGQPRFEPHGPVAGTLIATMARFMEDELHRLGDLSCEDFIGRCYEGTPVEELGHPAFRLLQYPAFDI